MSEPRNPSSEPRQRRSPAGDETGLRASILAGPEVSLLEISRAELVVESDVRLTPGAGICLNVTVGGANYLAGGRITRVDAALASGVVKYRAGIKLDNEIPAFDRATAEAAPASPPPPAPRRQGAVEKTPPPEAPPGAAEEPMDPQQTVQMLKTALRSSEAVRKELAEEHEAERARWEAERTAIEAKLAKLEKTATAAGQQVNASREAEKLLAGKHAQDHGAWAKERAALQETAKQADARVQQADARAKDSEARAQQAAARVKELEPRLKDLETRAAQADAAVKQGTARAEQLQREIKAAQEKERALQESLKKSEARAEQAARDLAAAKDNEQRLSRRIEEQAGKMDVLLKERQQLDSELDGALATVAAAEQKAATHEKDRRDWAAQKERLSARLQTTEKWCADQQELLYELQQHLGRAATLLDGWTPQRLEEEGEAAAPKGGRKATA